jgi:hypothetical protein
VTGTRSDRAFALTSQDSSGTSVGTAWNAFDAGARERLPVGRKILFGLHGGRAA